MDTATHFVMGFGLAGLSFVDPAVASQPMLAGAVMLATVIGSQAPDADTVLRLKGNALYIRNHRGVTHSLPFLALWPALITLVLSPLFGLHDTGTIGHLALWSFIAVAVHVFSDLFNTYGTQAARPLTERWIAWNIIHIFDPFIFGTHLAAIALWITGMIPPAPLFVTLYSMIAVYYIWRTVVHARITRSLKHKDIRHDPGEQYMAIPTITPRRWNVVKKKMDGTYCIGQLTGGRLEWFKNAASSTHPAVEHSKEHPDIQAFLYFTSYAVAEVEELPSGYIVRWGDVRYLHRKQFPFVAVIVMDHEYRALQTYVGWLSSEKLDERFAIEPGSIKV
ncbi:metal-dependent hydrolase [Paenibacillus sp. HN-1]|uniref:metal-dependent hydrolase n=1 Tax=Paenibacillus TaxID=44249 RepID=UPI001CA8C20D|nr:MULTISPECIES: metal-dependent hydrolase [Paenibacillus]MBY9078879.1 metal-dependent hydrolase [Paenibacillus sp. CGMCC 1.18879]MBY9082865.1 metal-dependent hydrolase [Paenibacillus sinensis]